MRSVQNNLNVPNQLDDFNISDELKYFSWHAGIVVVLNGACNYPLTNKAVAILAASACVVAKPIDVICQKLFPANNPLLTASNVSLVAKGVGAIVLTAFVTQSCSIPFFDLSNFVKA